MRPLTTSTFIAKRLADDWKLLLSIFFGITVATTLIAGAPIYVKTLERQGINTAIDRAPQVFLNIFSYAPHVPLSRGSLESSDRTLEDAIQRHAAPIYRGRERYLKAPTYLVGLPGQPLPQEMGEMVSRGYFQHLSNLEHHVRFLEGRMATDVIERGPRGPSLEAVIGTVSARVFGLEAGDAVVLTPSLGDPTRVSVKIVGILEPHDPSEEYWQHNASIFIEPRPLDEVPDAGIEVDPEEPPLALFITAGALTEGVGKAYPRTLVSSSWFVLVDKERLKDWSGPEARSSLAALETEMSSAFQGSAVFSGIKRLLDDFERRSFFSSVPLLLLLVIMVMTVLYYLSMMVSYLVQSRESDVALLRSRGVSSAQLLRLYALEGMVLTVVAVVLAPFLAFGAVAIAGKLPYFREITGGGMLPVELSWTPFLVAVGAGLISLAIFVIPGLVGARTSLVIHKLRSSRPPSVPIFQRYFLDVGLLALGGLIFWELHERGQLVSGGLFEGVRVNEPLLFAPVLLLTVVSLLFMRFFPLFVRFISGESPAVLHLVMAPAVTTLALAVAVGGLREGEGLAWLVPIVLLAALAGAYTATSRAEKPWPRLGGLALQVVLVALFVSLEPPVRGAVSFVPTIALTSIVPSQVIYLLLRRASRTYPVWVSMSLWRMARNPLQYSWLVLLLVMVTGLGVLATTVGGTLDRSHEERIRYEVAADIRVSGVPGFFARGRKKLKERYLTIPGVTTVSLALRGSGIVGTSFSGNRFKLLALESQDFPYISSFYRDDFSDRPLTGVMRALQSRGTSEPVLIPDGANTIGVWAKPEDLYPNVFLWMVIQDRRGVVDTVTLGELGPPRWSLMTTEIPSGLEWPLQLVSVQIFEPVFGPAGTPGSILLDDIHVVSGSDGEGDVLEDFEGQMKWTALATSMISNDTISFTGDDVYRGKASGIFSFGKDTDRGIRGFYQSPSGGPVPVVASSSFLAGAGTQVGDSIIVDVMGRLVPIVVADVVYYFPTLDPRQGGFLLADLDNMLRHLNILSPTSAIYPNELFIAEAPGAGEAVREVVVMLAASADLVHDRESMLASVRADPLVTAGWKVMVLLSMGIILFTASLGYVTYLLSFAERSRSEMGFLQSLGLSRRQMAGLLGLEHLVIIIIGLGLGTWAGFQMSTVMVSSVAVTETGDQVVPPFILTTDWSFMLPIYAALVAIFLAAIYRLTLSMNRLDLNTISRVEGQ